ncbi:hypothetical protein C8Q72DRAFT_846127 [Fomitopsis betulina]|nr:hypothetical protein C8Q72DRAFT_846127 [Fomitopsis betulina]
MSQSTKSSRSQSYLAFLWGHSPANTSESTSSTDGGTRSLLSNDDSLSQRVEELQNKLDETTAALDTKSRTVRLLEQRVRDLSSDLELAQANVRNLKAKTHNEEVVHIKTVLGQEREAHRHQLRMLEECCAHERTVLQKQVMALQREFQIREDAHIAEREKTLLRQEVNTSMPAKENALQQRSDRPEGVPLTAERFQLGTDNSETETRSETIVHLTAESAQASSQVNNLHELEEPVLARQCLAVSPNKDQRIAHLSEELAAARRSRNTLIEKLAMSDELARSQLQRMEQRSKQRESESRQVLAQYLSMIKQLQLQPKTTTEQNEPVDQQMSKRQEAELHALRSELSQAKVAVALAERQMCLLITLVRVSVEGRALTKQAAGFSQRADVVELLDRLKSYQRELDTWVVEAARTHRYNPQPETRELLLEQIWGKLVLSSPRLSEEWLAAALTGRQTPAR